VPTRANQRYSYRVQLIPAIDSGQVNLPASSSSFHSATECPSLAKAVQAEMQLISIFALSMAKCHR